MRIALTEAASSDIINISKGGQMRYEQHDGGRVAAGFKGDTRDCVTRAITIATGLDYREVYDLVNAHGKKERRSKKRGSKSSARTGVHKPTVRRIMKELGWEWTPTMQIGSGCKVHLKADELPAGRLVVSVSRSRSLMGWCTTATTRDARGRAASTATGSRRSPPKKPTNYSLTKAP
jgi:hypothetical protein